MGLETFQPCHSQALGKCQAGLTQGVSILFDLGYTLGEPWENLG